MVEIPSFYPYLTAHDNLEYYRLQRGIPGSHVVDEALERPYKSWLEVAQTTGDSRFLKEIMADCQERFSRKMDEKGVTPLIPDPETAARLL